MQRSLPGIAASTRRFPIGAMLLPLLMSGLLFAFPGCNDGGDGDDDSSSSPEPTEVPAESHISVSRSSLDFGVVDVGSSLDQVLLVSNSGSSPLSLVASLPLNPSDQYSVAGDGGAVPDQIPAGGSVSLTVTFAASEVGEAAGTLRIESDDPGRSRIDVPMTAEGKAVGDEDEDGYSVEEGDCNDHDDSIYPGAREICDGEDNNCDGQIDEDGLTTYYQDRDGDGHGDPGTAFEACKPGKGAISVGDDCDDGEASTYPGAAEACDGKDNDCDTEIDEDASLTFYQDRDQDSFGDDSATATGCTAPEGYAALGGDCNEDDALINPAADELCDGEDNNCDGQVDENLETTFYRDADADGFGDANDFVSACEAPDGYVADDGVPAQHDCDDSSATTYPGATELCDKLDNDCDGQVDEDNRATFYADDDGDGYGNAGDTATGCAASEGYVADNTDCNDDDGSIYPAATEACDGKDNDCNGEVDEAGATPFYADGDGDGHGNASIKVVGCDAPDGYVADGDDCNDKDPSVYPGASEVCNGSDEDCDSQVDDGVLLTYYADADGDGYGDSSKTVTGCSAPKGYVGQGGDCNDASDKVHPGLAETCDGLDNNCDGKVDEGVLTTWYADGDSDGYGDPKQSTQACSAPKGYVADATDCDDSQSGTHPGALELCDGLDNDCNAQVDEGVKTTYYLDSDGDGFGVSSAAIQACTKPAGYSSNATDCDDKAATTYPGAPELCDGKDNSCDGKIDEGVTQTFYADADSDGYGDASTSTQACAAGNGFVADKTDCDDGNAAVHPGASEVCNGKDENCNGQADEGVTKTFYADADGDGYGDSSKSTTACTAPTGYVADKTDCNDLDKAINPGATELCNSKDDNCNGQIDEGASKTWYADADGDGYGNASKSTTGCTAPTGYVADKTDCNDGDATVNPAAQELCNFRDDNCNGQVDEGFGSSCAKVLVWSTGNSSTYTQNVAAWLMASGKFTSVTGINQTNMTLADLKKYDEVFFYTNSSSGSDPNNGNVLADYADTGRRLVLCTFSWANQNGNTLGGRIITDGMAPYKYEGESLYTNVTMTSYDATSAFFTGVTTITGYYHDNVSVISGATSYATWSDGRSLLARKKNVVGVNLFPDDNYANIGGDYKKLFVNSLTAP